MKTKSLFANYLFILPAVLVFSVFYVIPFIWVFNLSLFDWDGISPTKVFVGLGNFKEIIFDDLRFWQSMRNGAYITLIALTFQNALAFLLALICNGEIKFKNFYRTIFFLPPILSEIVVGLVWRFIINDIEGANIINRFLTSIGLVQFTHSWLADPRFVLSTVAIIHSWKGFGWGFLIFLAGLQIIPKQLYEIAQIDGAGSWFCFKKITLPLMMPIIILVMILTILGTMQAFALVLGLVGGEFAGHTSVPVLRILTVMRETSRFGYACAQGIILGVILVIISFLHYRLSRRYRQY